MFVAIDRSSGLSIRHQLNKSLKESILKGELPSNYKMPSTRALAEELHIARSTVVECYEQLIAEGYLYGKEGSGTYVNDGIFYEAYETKEEKETSVEDGLLYETPKGYISFRPGVPDLPTIPIQQWGKLYRDVASMAVPEDLDYNSVFGAWPLRKALAFYLRRVRGVETSPSNILITGGAAQAFSLLSELVGQDEGVIVEEPASTGMVKTFTSHHIRCRPVPVDEKGLVTDLLPKKAWPLILTTPSHQFPMGCVMSVKRRIELIRYAKEHQVYIVEDDYDSEFRYEGTPIQSMQNLAPDRVIYVGTFSKTLMPAIRMGYMVLPDSLIEAMKDRKYASDLHSPVLEQLTMAWFIEEGLMDRHIRKMAKLYGKRRKLLVKTVKERFGDHVTISGDGAGLHFIATFDEIKDIDSLQERLTREKVQVRQVSDYYLDRNLSSPNQFVIGFGNLQNHEITEGVERMKRALLHKEEACVTMVSATVNTKDRKW